MKYFSRSFTLHHILTHIQLPAEIPVWFAKRIIGNVKMVMNKRKVKGKDVGGAMITTNWMELDRKSVV